jgi:uncharacterized protein YcbX
MDALYLSQLNIYPVKSLGGISLQHVQIEEKGLQYDRRWMLVDEEGVFITQRKHFELAMLQVAITDGQLVISHKQGPEQHISFGLEENTGKVIPVTIWDDQANGIEVSIRVNEWFSDFMKMKVTLVQMPEEEQRFVDPQYATGNEIVSFADGYPCLLIGESALAELNEKLAEPVRMDRFRPNLVFSGGIPHLEDTFGSFTIGDIQFSAVKPCARCVLTTIDQQTGDKGPEPLKTLGTYRLINKKIMFGQNLIHKGSGTISLGQELKIQDWKA